MSTKYLIVFDTNILHISYDKKADFTRFHFNSTFKNVIDKVEELDIYQDVNVAVPELVWEELRQQKIYAYHDKLEKVNKYMGNFRFPFHQWQNSGEGDGDYSNYIDQEISQYKEELQGRQVAIKLLSLPSQNRFPSIVKRALEKRPPFEGRDGKADKGFKDALLWESILEYKSEHIDVQILLYTKDQIFNEELAKEYSSLFNEMEIKIFNHNEEALLIYLEEVARKIDKFAYIPKEKSEDQDIKEWLCTKNFIKQIEDHATVFQIVNKYVHFNSIQVLDIYDINREMDNNQLLEKITISLQAKVIFDVQEKTKIEDIYDLSIDVELIDSNIFVIETVFINEDSDDESE